jgi:DNA-binding winged helix-turn-helix (wHTH) protein
MPHVFIVDIDDLTLAAITEFIRERGQSAGALPADTAHSDPESAAGHFDDTSSASSNLASLKLVKLSGAAAGARNYAALSATTASRATDELPILRASGNLLPTHSRITLLFAGWRLEIASRELWTASDAPVALSSGEFELLFTFAKHPQRALTRHQIIDLMRGDARLSHPRSVDVYVSRLRQKLESDTRRPQIIQTVRNGYRFNAPVTIR